MSARLSSVGIFTGLISPLALCSFRKYCRKAKNFDAAGFFCELTIWISAWLSMFKSVGGNLSFGNIHWMIPLNHNKSFVQSCAAIVSLSHTDWAVRRCFLDFVMIGAPLTWIIYPLVERRVSLHAAKSASHHARIWTSLSKHLPLRNRSLRSLVPLK